MGATRTGYTHFSGLVVGGPQSNGVFQGGLSYMESGTVAVNPASLSNGAEADTSVTLSNAKAGDFVLFNPPAAGLTAGMEVCGFWVSADSTAKIRLRNNSGSPIDEPSGNWSYLLLRA